MDAMSYLLRSSNKFICWAVTASIAVASCFYASLAGAFFGLGEPKIEILTPSQINEGGIVPINIRAENFGGDPIKTLSVTLEANPPEQQKALTVSFEKPQPMVFVSTRLRLAAAGANPITIQVGRASGNVVTKTFLTGLVQKPVDFQNPDTLSVIFKGTFVFPTDEIGQPQIRVQKKKGDSSELEIRGFLHHPMLPASKNSSGLFVDSVEFFYEREKIATVNTGTALTNDPFLQLNVKDDRPIGVAKMIWKDVMGNFFEASK